MTTEPARCLVRGCPLRFTTGDDRLCLDHRDETGPTAAARAAAFDLLTLLPGDYADEPRTRQLWT